MNNTSYMDELIRSVRVLAAEQVELLTGHSYPYVADGGVVGVKQGVAVLDPCRRLAALLGIGRRGLSLLDG